MKPLNVLSISIQALIERGDEAANQPVDDEENTFLHVAARSGALRSIQVSDTVVSSNVVIQLLIL